MSIAASALRDFFDDKAPRLGASLAYFTVFSLPPFLALTLAIAGWAWGREAAQRDIVDAFGDMLGPQGAKTTNDLITATTRPRQGVLATTIGAVALLLGAAGVFGQLRDALNTVFEAEAKKVRGLWGFLRDRFLSFAMVFSLLFLLIVSLALTAALAALGRSLGDRYPGNEFVWQALNLLIVLGILAFAFSILYKFVPDARIAWRDALIGGASTAGLFVLGKFLIGLYLGRSATASTYGAASALVLLLLWVYYSGLIMVLGAELTQVLANRYGERVRPGVNPRILRSGKRTGA